MQLHKILYQENPCYTSLPAEAAVARAVSALGRYGKTAVVVMESGRLKGILTRTDVLSLLERGGNTWTDEKSISQLMTRDLVSADPDASFDHALDCMAQFKIEHLPVIKDGRLLTVVHAQELLRLRVRFLQSDIDQLQAYIDNLHNAAQD